MCRGSSPPGFPQGFGEGARSRGWAQCCQVRGKVLEHSGGDLHLADKRWMRIGGGSGRVREVRTVRVEAVQASVSTGGGAPALPSCTLPGRGCDGCAPSGSNNGRRLFRCGVRSSGRCCLWVSLHRRPESQALREGPGADVAFAAGAPVGTGAGDVLGEGGGGALRSAEHDGANNEGNLPP